MSFNEFKKRKVVDLTLDTSKTPSKKEACLMLLEGEDVIQKSLCQLDTTKAVFSSKDLKSGRVVRWYGNCGWSNPFSKLRTLYGGKQQMYDSYWAAKAAQAQDSKTGGRHHYCYQLGCWLHPWGAGRVWFVGNGTRSELVSLMLILDFFPHSHSLYCKGLFVLLRIPSTARISFTSISYPSSAFPSLSWLWAS